MLLLGSVLAALVCGFGFVFVVVGVRVGVAAVISVRIEGEVVVH